jgi:hypothetical protein
LSAPEEPTLLDALNHRIRNELAAIVDLVAFRAVLTDNVGAKQELGNVIDLLQQHVQVHSILTMPDRDGLVDDRTSAASRNSFALDFPLTQRERQASRALAARRPRTGRRAKTMPPRYAPMAGDRMNAIAVQPEL